MADLPLMLNLVFTSKETTPMTELMLMELLTKSRKNNVRDGITGVLLYREGTFLQVLEGYADKVHTTFSRVLRDNRHHAIKVLLEKPITEWKFRGYAMGFNRLSSSSSLGLEGFTRFLESNFYDAAIGRPGEALMLLELFKRQSH